MKTHGVAVNKTINDVIFAERIRYLRQGVEKRKSAILIKYIKRGIPKYKVGEELAETNSNYRIHVTFPDEVFNKICGLMADELENGREVSFCRLTKTLFTLGYNGGIR